MSNSEVKDLLAQFDADEQNAIAKGSNFYQAWLDSPWVPRHSKQPVHKSMFNRTTTTMFGACIDCKKRCPGCSMTCDIYKKARQVFLDRKQENKRTKRHNDLRIKGDFYEY